MKHIVKKLTPSNQILESELPPNPLIGFIVASGKGWFQRIAFRQDKYIALGTNGLGSANGWSLDGSGAVGTLKQWMDWANETPISNMYLFDTDQELLKWLAE